MGLFKIWHLKNFCLKMEIDGEMASDQKYSHIEGSLTLQHWRICGNKNFPLAKKISLRPPQANLLFFIKNCCGGASWTLFITQNEVQSYKQVHRPCRIKSVGNSGNKFGDNLESYPEFIPDYPLQKSPTIAIIYPPHIFLRRI